MSLQSVIGVFFDDIEVSLDPSRHPVSFMHILNTAWLFSNSYTSNKNNNKINTNSQIWKIESENFITMKHMQHGLVLVLNIGFYNYMYISGNKLNSASRSPESKEHIEETKTADSICSSLFMYSYIM